MVEVKCDICKKEIEVWSDKPFYSTTKDIGVVESNIFCYEINDGARKQNSLDVSIEDDDFYIKFDIRVSFDGDEISDLCLDCIVGNFNKAIKKGKVTTKYLNK